MTSVTRTRATTVTSTRGHNMTAAQYWTLVRTLGVSEFKLRFAHSVLGYAWTLSKPLMLFGVMYFVFSEMLRFGEGIPHYPVMLLTGIMLWGFFSEATSGAVTVLVSRADLVRKAWFPRSALAVSVVATAVTVLLFNLVALAMLVAIAGVEPRLTWLLFVPLLLELLLLTVGLSLLLSGLFVFLRDIGQLWTVLLQVLFYMTPIIYPIELLEQEGVSRTLQRALLSSPLAQIIQDTRVAMLGGSDWTFERLGPLAPVPFLLVVAALGAGLLVYRRHADRLAERV